MRVPQKIFRSRWVITNVLAALAAMVVFVLLIGSYMHQQLITNLESSTKVAFSAAYDSVSKKLHTVSDICKDMSSDTFLISALENEGADQEVFRQNVSKYLTNKCNLYGLSTAYVVSDASMHYYLPNGSAKILDPQKNEWDNWYTSLLESDDNYHVDVDIDKHNTGKWTVFIDWRIRDTDGNDLGIAGVGIDSETITNEARRYTETFNVSVSFVDSDGTVNIGSNATEITGASRNVASEDAGHMQVEMVNDRCIVSQYLPLVGWHLVIESDRIPIADAMRGLVIIAAALLVLSIVAIVLLNVRLFSSERRALTNRANTDPLTGLNNRAGLELSVSMYLSSKFPAKEGSNLVAALVAIDIDHFKIINDSLGHAAGDDVLRDVADVLRTVFRDSDIIARPGGDEFVVFLPTMRTRETLETRVKELCEKCKIVYPREDGDDIQLSISAGIAMAPQNGITYADLSRAADAALYRVKRSGRDGYHFA